ncbi:MAG: hypothetical protein V1799_14665 [bacterium]
MKILSIILISIALTVPGCKDSGSEPPLSLLEEDIQEAVFQYQFLHNYSGLQQQASAYFIGIYRRGDSVRQGSYLDIAETLLARFHGSKPPVKKVSQCIQSINGVFDKETGERGLLFRIESIKQVSNDVVEVEGGYFEGGLSASGNIYTVQRNDHRWVVVKDRMLWIS